MRGDDVNQVQIPGKKIEPKRPLLDTLTLEQLHRQQMALLEEQQVLLA